LESFSQLFNPAQFIEREHRNLQAVKVDYLSIAAAHQPSGQHKRDSEILRISLVITVKVSFVERAQKCLLRPAGIS
jgi:hypothetical protein